MSCYSAGSIRQLSGTWLVVDLERRVILDGSVDFSERLAQRRADYVGFPMNELVSKTAGARFTEDLLGTPGWHETVTLRTGSGRQMVADVRVSGPAYWDDYRVVFCWIFDRTERHPLTIGRIDDYRASKREVPRVTLEGEPASPG